MISLTGSSLVLFASMFSESPIWIKNNNQLSENVCHRKVELTCPLHWKFNLRLFSRRKWKGETTNRSQITFLTSDVKWFSRMFTVTTIIRMQFTRLLVLWLLLLKMSTSYELVILWKVTGRSTVVFFWAPWSVIDFSSNILIETFRTVTFYDLGDTGSCRIDDSEFWAWEL